jgi:hypothetical protein
MSDNTGAYHFNAIPTASNSTITPIKDDNPLNGVTTFDLVMISKHILGLQLLNGPYNRIAADANRSGTITTFDVVEFRKLILGIYQSLPNNTSWRFVDKSYAFPDLNNPFAPQFPENKLLTNLYTDKVGEDFVAIKVGDVNGSAIANAQQKATDRTAGTLLFDVQDRTVKAGDEFTVHFKATQKVQGYQFTMSFVGLEVLDIKPGVNMQQTNFAVFSQDGAVTTSWDAPPGMPATATLFPEFDVKFRALKSGRLDELLMMSSRITKAEAYDTDDQQLDVAFCFHQDNSTTITGVKFELYQNQPNPFEDQTFIGFSLPEATTATLTIYDETGRLLYTQRGDFAKGYNAVAIDISTINPNGAGVLYYQIETPTDSDTKKMIRSR